MKGGGPTFATEAELCAAFAVTAERCGWDVWPEVAGWDLVLVSRGPGPNEPRRVAGFQIAVEAKLRPGLGAIASAAGRCQFYDGKEAAPHAAAVLVPTHSAEFRTVAIACGLHVYTPGPEHNYIIAPPPRWDGAGLPLPPIRLSGNGGHPSPRVLSKWRIGALRLCSLLETRGVLVREDFRREGVEPQRWLDGRWIVRDGDSRPARYVAAERLVVDGPCVGYEAEQAALREKDIGRPVLVLAP